MSAEGMPQTRLSLLGRMLKLVTELVARFPVSVIVISALLAALSMTAAQLGLGFRTSRSDLLNPKSAYNRRWAEFVQEFGEQDDVVLVVRGDTPRNVAPIIDELAELLGRQPKLFRSILSKVDTSKLRSKGLYQDQIDLPKLQQIDAFLTQSQSIVQGSLSSLNIGGQIIRIARLRSLVSLGSSRTSYNSACPSS